MMIPKQRGRNVVKDEQQQQQQQQEEVQPMALVTAEGGGDEAIHSYSGGRRHRERSRDIEMFDSASDANGRPNASSLTTLDSNSAAADRANAAAGAESSGQRQRRRVHYPSAGQIIDLLSV